MPLKPKLLKEFQLSQDWYSQDYKMHDTLMTLLFQIKT